MRRKQEEAGLMLGMFLAAFILAGLATLYYFSWFKPNQERRAREAKQQYTEMARKYDWKITQEDKAWISDGAPHVETYRSAGRCIFTDKNKGTQITIIGDFQIERIPERND